MTQTSNLTPVPILVYHQIAAAPAKGSPFRSLYVSPQAFKRQMGLLKLLGYTGLSMSGLMPYLRGERQGRVVGITFDDGYQNNLTHALPVLDRYGFSSTCYAVSGLLGQTNSWDRHLGIPQVPLMDAGGLRRWVAGGQEIGSHTHQHIDLLATDEARCRDEIASGKAALEVATGAPVRHFCYPFGRYTGAHAAMTREAGFQSATTTVRGRCQPASDLFELPRVPVVRSTSLLTFWLKVATSYEDSRGKNPQQSPYSTDVRRDQVTDCALRS